MGKASLRQSTYTTNPQNQYMQGGGCQHQGAHKATWIDKSGRNACLLLAVAGQRLRMADAWTNDKGIADVSELPRKSPNAFNHALWAGRLVGAPIVNR